MDRNLRNHPAISMILGSFQQYQNGTLDIAGLQANVSAGMGALEGDIPKPVRDAVFSAEGELDGLRFTTDGPEQAEEVDKLFGDLEKLIDDADW